MLGRVGFVAVCLLFGVVGADTTVEPLPEVPNPAITVATNLSFGKPEVKVVSNGVTFVGFREFITENVHHELLYSGKADVFLGIPYAVPLTKQTSFRKSVKITQKPNTTVIAKEYSHACLQNPANAWIPIYGVGVSHDCLTLNIFKPVNANASNTLPILVFFHGGFFVQGTAAQFLPKSIIRSYVNRGFVVITVQYRVGIWGFLTDYSSTGLTANRAITDAATALSYIHDIAADFGGDASQITLLGHSAGACLVDGLAMTPQYKNLFKRAGMSSGSRRFCQESKGINGDPRKTQNQALIETYCPNVNHALLPNSITGKKLEDCLLSYNFTQLITIQNKTQVGFTFVVDRRVINNPYLPSFGKTPINVNHDILYSSSAQEYAGFDSLVSRYDFDEYNASTIDARINTYTKVGVFPPAGTRLQRRQVEAIKYSYVYPLVSIDYSFDNETYRDINAQLFTDVSFVLPAIRSIVLANSTRVYYMVNSVPWTPFYRSSGYAAATHTSDINRMFPSYPWTGDTNVFAANLEYELISVNNFADVWSNFAKTGKPTPTAVPAMTGASLNNNRVSPLACTVVTAESVEDTRCVRSSELLFEELPSLFYWNQTTLAYF
uniref:Carboxylic ester hydrolase n=1 Tax=Panagrellus redivivus TaxID=6233 RepID=A0A7E5A0G6_PANRE